MEGSHLLDAATGTKGARWLQTLEGDAPVLLVNNKRMCSWMSEDKIDALVEELKK